MSEVEPVVAKAPAPRESSFKRIIGTIVNPAPTLQSIAERPNWLVPLLLFIVVALTAQFITLRRFDVETMLREEYAKAGMEEAQVNQMAPTAAKIQKVAGPFFILIGIPALLALAAGVFLLAFKLMGAEGTFKKNFGILNYAAVPHIVKSILSAALILPKADVSKQELMTLVKSNLGFLVDSEERPLAFALLSSVDAFWIWWLVLVTIGLSYVSKLSRTTVAIIALILYGFLVLLSVAAVAMQSAGAAS